MKPINILCGQNAELLIVKAGGTYSSHQALKIKKISILLCVSGFVVTRVLPPPPYAFINRLVICEILYRVLAV
jgi:hypothetical protein